jgi:phosphoserine aminotransferase
VYNFAAGPAIMPRAVLEQARDELLDWRGTGMSVWEMPFTGAEFREIIATVRSRLGTLLEVPPNYRILLMHAGASTQFSLVPLNLLGAKAKADYVESGHWALKAIREGRRYCAVNVAASNAEGGYTRLAGIDEWRLDADAAYCHITSNETANGLEYHWTPDTGAAPLVADMTSSFLSRPVEVSRYGVIYAGAQKNIGPAGLTVVIVRDDLIGRARPETPSVLDYEVQAESESMVNTPLTYPVYLAGLVLAWIEDRGGLAAMAEACAAKSATLYAEIESDGFYECPVRAADRSRINICFRIAERALEDTFVEEAAGEGLVNLKGHSAYGGLRASLYNAMPEAGVAALVGFMREFRRRRG